MKFKKKPIIIEATQWFKNGNHTAVKPYVEGYITVLTPNDLCDYCGKPLRSHGWIDTLEGGHIVCPGDWIITGIAGERYPVKADIFEGTYDKL